MRKDESGDKSWCKHIRNSDIGKRNHQKRIRSAVREHLNREGNSVEASNRPLK